MREQNIEIIVRRVGPDDSALLLSWKNDPGALRNSLVPKPVAQRDHDAWFHVVTSSDQNLILLAEKLNNSSAASEPVGMCRFDLKNANTARVSINLSPTWRGGGLARSVLTACLKEFHREYRKVDCVIAEILPGNIASQRIFFSVGFRRKNNLQGHELWEKYSL